MPFGEKLFVVNLRNWKGVGALSEVHLWCWALEGYKSESLPKLSS